MSCQKGWKRAVTEQSMLKQLLPDRQLQADQRPAVVLLD